VNNYLSDIGAKRLELLRELVPNVGTIGILVNPNFPDAQSQSRDIQAAARIVGQQIHLINASRVNPNNPTSELTDAQAAARTLGLQIHVLNANTESDIDQAFASAVQQGVGALIVGADPFFNGRRDQVVALAARERVPAIYYSREFAAAGGLMSYGASSTEVYRQGGTYTGRVLKGEKPADMPVMQLSKFELVINRKTAKDLGLSIPSGVLAIADEVIE
jgi:putative ABC transport system substrate-binding protein